MRRASSAVTESKRPITNLLVGRLSAPVAGSVVDDEGLGSGGMDDDAETRELRVPGGSGFLGRLEGVDGPLVRFMRTFAVRFSVLMSMPAP